MALSPDASKAPETCPLIDEVKAFLPFLPIRQREQPFPIEGVATQEPGTNLRAYARGS